MALVYIAGPYSAPDQATITRNVMRAVALGAAAAELGHTPYVPHALGYLRVYGSPWEADNGRSRATALRCATDMARTVALASGELWAIEAEGKDLYSSGTQLEVDTFLAHSVDGATLRSGTWAWWEEFVQRRSGTELDYLVSGLSSVFFQGRSR